MSKQPFPLVPPNIARGMKRYRTEIAVFSSSTLTTFLTFPLDSIKTRVQGTAAPNFQIAVRDLWHHEGLHGFWRGAAAPVLSVTLVRTAGFSVYVPAKQRLSEIIGRVTGEEEPLVKVNTPGSMPSLDTISCFGLAGAVAGAVSTVVSSPFELIKNCMVLSKQIASTANAETSPIAGTYVGKGTWKTGKQIIRNCGVTGLYTGFRLQLIRELLGTSLYFMTYESSKQFLVAYSDSHDLLAPWAVALAGATCGMVSLAASYPLDRAKTVYQRERLEFGKARPSPLPSSHYFKQAGYRGMSVAVTRSAATNAVLFSIFEYMMKRIDALEG